MGDVHRPDTAGPSRVVGTKGDRRTIRTWDYMLGVGTALILAFPHLSAAPIVTAIYIAVLARLVLAFRRVAD